MTVMDHSGCVRCHGDLEAVFVNGLGWADLCPECASAPEAVMVAAWPEEDGQSIILMVGDGPVVLAVADARRISGALAGALALRDAQAVAA